MSNVVTEALLFNLRMAFAQEKNDDRRNGIVHAQQAMIALRSELQVRSDSQYTQPALPDGSSSARLRELRKCPALYKAWREATVRGCTGTR
jgi:hypothetical protein